jgi:hypothetical protein
VKGRSGEAILPLRARSIEGVESRLSLALGSTVKMCEIRDGALIKNDKDNR